MAEEINDSVKKTKPHLAAQAKAKIKVQNDMVRGVVGFRTAVMAN